MKNLVVLFAVLDVVLMVGLTVVASKTFGFIQIASIIGSAIFAADLIYGFIRITQLVNNQNDDEGAE